jgi:hypothetical protein
MIGIPAPFGGSGSGVPDPPPPPSPDEIIKEVEDEVLGWLGAESPRSKLRRLIAYKYLYARGCRISECDERAVRRAAREIKPVPNPD